MKLHHCAWACLTVLMSCAGSSTTSNTTTTPVAATESAPAAATPETPAAATPAAPAVAWASMNHDQKMEYMEHTVMPEMRQMFQQFDAHRFEHFTCATCHGANAREVNFHMPNGIAPLDPTTIPAMFASQDPMQVFMTQRLWPRMTEMLGAQRYNPETHQGFGCLGCHGMRAPAAAPAAAAPAATPAAAPAAAPAARPAARPAPARH